MNKTLKYTSTCLGLLAVPLSANLRLNFDTDAAGNPIVGTGAGYTTYGATAGSFTGTGTPDANIVTGSNSSPQIIGVGTGAVLAMDIIDDANAQNFNPEVPRMETTFSLTGGTADVGFQRNGSYWKGFTLSNMAGVSELCLTSVVDLPLHGRSNSTSTNSGGLPWGFSTGLLDPGTGIMNSDFNITYTVSGLTYLTDPLDPATSAAVPAIGSTITQGGWENETFSSTALVFESTDGFTGLTGGGGDPDNLLVRGVSASGSVSTSDIASFYATTYEICITPSGGASTFAADTTFVFSYDGDRTQEVPAVIPEPTSALMMALASVALVGRRKR